MGKRYLREVCWPQVQLPGQNTTGAGPRRIKKQKIRASWTAVVWSQEFGETARGFQCIIIIRMEPKNNRKRMKKEETTMAIKAVKRRVSSCRSWTKLESRYSIHVPRTCKLRLCFIFLSLASGTISLVYTNAFTCVFLHVTMSWLLYFLSV